MTEVTLAVVGGGLRGLTYARRAHATGAGRVVAVAEPDPQRRAAFVEEFGIAPERAYPGWKELVAAGRLADAAVVATHDQLHTEPTVALADLGYHILLEKPMATTEREATMIADAARRNGTVLSVCHVMRYTPYTRVVEELLESGRIGRLISVQHLEPVGWWHQAHSFVRGHWRRQDTSAPMLLAKACHDIDWLVHLFGRPPVKVSSFGSLAHFRDEERPAAAADRCLDCPLEPTCPYSAPRLYLDCLGDPEREFWPLAAVTPGRTREDVLEALRTGPYGRCVYACDNDVVDHQEVVMEFDDGTTCSFTMSAFTPMEYRHTRLFGTHGYIDGDGSTLRLVDFRTGDEETITVGRAGSAADDGHGGGDEGLTDAFLAAVAAGDPGLLRTDAAESLMTHRVVWAAEQARLTGSVVTL
ncbi:Gfo/Idh/MocA family protein [Nonomuraea jiangxiensis]|uniref:Oxidoreductase family, C-terminal alpha/beta domain n=1 Tax=Nonomuraea jiangxiensis TaxID=633440 RepID=A0A1G7Z3V0_9ACTN|nr:Gfo/Idh/MocA family oxidoreductase [Nonomuraea jiangxiensis]SDH03398.1 Oxidoreductase family, C-terminal alpha/beta domain [Nonomuraea jiangxiensis]